MHALPVYADNTRYVRETKLPAQLRVHIIIRSLIILAAVLLVSRVCYAATFTFDGFIERETENANDHHHTLDFFRIYVPSSSLLTIVGTEDTLPDLFVGLYLQGPRGNLELSGLVTTRLSDTALQIEGVPAVGDYVLAVLPDLASDWDRFEGLKSNFSVSGQPPPLGLGSYHIEINGDFTVTEILEGHLDIPEPSTQLLGLFAVLLCVWNLSVGKIFFARGGINTAIADSCD